MITIINWLVPEEHPGGTDCLGFKSSLVLSKPCLENNNSNNSKEKVILSKRW